MQTQPDHKEEFQDVFPLKHNYGLFTLSHKRKMSIHFKCQLFSLLYSHFYAAVHCNFSVVWGVRSKSDDGKNKTKRPLWSECIWINTSSKCFEQSSSSDLRLYSSSLKLAWRWTLSKMFRSGGRVCRNGRPRKPSADLRKSIFHGWKSRTFNISPLRRQWATGSIICGLCVMERVDDVCQLLSWINDYLTLHIS